MDKIYKKERVQEHLRVLQYRQIPNVKHFQNKHLEILNLESTLFNGFFRLEKLSIFEYLDKKLTCLTFGIYCTTQPLFRVIGSLTQPLLTRLCSCTTICTLTPTPKYHSGSASPPRRMHENPLGFAGQRGPDSHVYNHIMFVQYITLWDLSGPTVSNTYVTVLIIGLPKRTLSITQYYTVSACISMRHQVAFCWRSQPIEERCGLALYVLRIFSPMPEVVLKPIRRLISSEMAAWWSLQFC